MRIGRAIAHPNAIVHKDNDSHTRCDGRTIKQFIGAKHANLAVAAAYAGVRRGQLCTRCFTRQQLTTVPA